MSCAWWEDAVADVLHKDDKWRVAAGSAPADERTRVLKHDETFAIYDRYGDIQSVGLGEEGLYHQDTRFLSYQVLSIDGGK